MSVFAIVLVSNHVWTLSARSSLKSNNEAAGSEIGASRERMLIGLVLDICQEPPQLTSWFGNEKLERKSRPTSQG